MKRKHARPWLTRVSFRGVVHGVNRSTGGRTPHVMLDCEASRWERGLNPEYRRVPTEAKFTGREVDCMACVVARTS